MADPFSITASAVGIAAFGHQLVQSVRTIKQFCRDVKNAPEELQETLEEIAELGRIMARLGTEEAHSPGATADEEILNRSIQLCQRAVNRVFTLATELQAEMQRSKVIGAVKTTLRKRDLQAMLSKLDRSKADLHFAYSLYVDARRTNEAEKLRQYIQEDKAQQTGLIEQVLKNQEQILATGTCALEESKSRAVVGRGRRSGRSNFRREMHFRPPSWLCQYACDFLFEKASGRWTATLKTYRIIEDRNVRRMCEVGDIVGIRDLLENRQLSIHDQFPGYGETSLYSVAINDQQTDLARYLLECGGDATGDTWINFGFKGVYMQGLCFTTIPSDKDRLSYMRAHAELIQEHYEYDWEEMSFAVDAVAKHPSHWTAFERLLVLSGLTDIRSFDLFSDLLGPSEKIAELFLVREPWHGVSLSHAIAMLWRQASAICTSRADVSGFVLDRCQELLEIGVKCGADFHKRDQMSRCRTPFLWLLLSLPTVELTGSIQNWVSILCSAGLDIEWYGEIEHRNFRALRDRESDVPGVRWFYDYTDIVGFTFGPNPSDWVFYFDNDKDTYAGAFWRMIEQPELAIPGAWPPEAA